MTAGSILLYPDGHALKIILTFFKSFILGNETPFFLFSSTRRNKFMKKPDAKGNEGTVIDCIFCFVLHLCFISQHFFCLVYFFLN